MSERQSTADLKWPLRIRQNRQQGVLVFILAGRVGRASADTLRHALEAAIEGGQQRLVIDFGSVDYLSSAGLPVLAAASNRLPGPHGALVLCALAEPVRVVFDLAGVLHHFVIESSRERAVERAAR